MASKAKAAPEVINVPRQSQELILKAINDANLAVQLTRTALEVPEGWIMSQDASFFMPANNGNKPEA
jgi:hypothetical protein